MPNRFSVAFRRKTATTSEDLQSRQPSSTDQAPSFRVLERGPPSGARTFDGGNRPPRASVGAAPKPAHSEAELEDNMFAGLNTYGYRGSGGSNTTKATSTDTSSRHSNASTAPSSADMAHMHDDPRGKRFFAQEPDPRQPKPGGSFLDRAGRTFSFGMQKKHAPQPPIDEPVPDVPPLPTFQREDETGRTRALTASTTSTATPPKVEDSSALDLGGDFGSMFTGFDKRSSAATLRNEPPAAQRPAPPAALSLDKTTAVDPSPSSWNSQNSCDRLMGSSTLTPAANDKGPPTPRHQPSFEYRSSTSPSGVVEDADAKFFADSVAATRFLSDRGNDGGRSARHGRDQDEYSFAATHRKPMASEQESEDNLFAGTAARFSRPAYKPTARSPSPPRSSKVMTTAEFERYQKQKEREHLEKAIYGGSAEDDDDDDINYDDDEDEEEKLQAQEKLKRNKQAKMLEYRQRNMKTTGNLGRLSPTPSSRPSLPPSLSAPQLAFSVTKTPSPEPVRQASEEDDDEEIPLAILQAHGFPSKARAPSRLSAINTGSDPRLRVTSQIHAARPGSGLLEPSSATSRRSSTLPVFARGLPQDIPYVGANVARPAVRESLPYGGGAAAPPPQPQPQTAPIPPGGLVGVIANEERARAMRRGSPSIENQRLGGAITPNVDPLAGIPPHMMYERGGHHQGGAGMQRMSQQPAFTPADQAQLQMSQQMSEQMTQFMQMQMQFMQMMAANQGQGGQQRMPYQMPQQMQQMQQQMLSAQQPYGMFGGNQSHADLSGQSMSGQPAGQHRRLDPSSRTMSMIQPITTSGFLQGGFGQPQGPGTGYSPSIAPSERSNVGLPGRYRPVSQASGAFVGQHQRAASISGALSLSQPEDLKSRSSIRPSAKPKVEADDDDQEGWEAMRAQRENKKSRWRRMKGGN